MASQQRESMDQATHRESVNKHLQAWHKAGWIDLSKGTIVIRNLTAIDGS
jgi:hypothetical protein